MIINWGGDPYADGLSYAFVAAPQYAAAVPQPADYSLVYDPFLLLWQQSANETVAGYVPTGFVLVYDPFLFIWVQSSTESVPGWRADASTTCGFTSPTTTSGSFRADAAGACEFEATYLDNYWVSQGWGSNTWSGYSNLQYGFRADAKSTCNFNANATMLRMDAKSGAGFNAIQAPPPSGWKATSKGSCRLMTGVGQGEDCLTSGVVPEGSFPNFVY